MLNLQTDILKQVTAEAKRNAAQHPRWLVAIDRASVELESNPWIEAQDDHTLLIGSPSGNTYIGNGTCQCIAFQRGVPCWHRAAARLYHRYVVAEQATPVLAPLGERLAKARREMDALFS
jgi:hypothetical protein